MKEYEKPMLEMIMVEEDAIRTSLIPSGDGSNDNPIEWSSL